MSGRPVPIVYLRVGVVALMAAVGLAGCASSGSDRTAPAGGVTPRRDARGHARRATHATDSAAVDHVLSYTSYIRVGSRRRKDVALTFDDGPSPYTARILSTLERSHVPATFFEIGRQARALPELARREQRDGFPVGDHTLTHPALALLSAARQRAEILQGAQRIEGTGAPPPRLFRPPYGSFNSNTLGVIRAQHMLMVLWSVDTKDFSRPGVKRIIYTALSGARAGAIILMHDGGGPRDQTAAALPRIIAVLQRRGFHLVTVPQLVADDPPPRDQPVPAGLAGTG